MKNDLSMCLTRNTGVYKVHVNKPVAGVIRIEMIFACEQARVRSDQDKRSLHVFEKECWSIQVACEQASGRSDQERSDLCMC